MNKDNKAHIYELKKHWQFMNKFGGYWTWLILFSELVLFFYLIPFYKWMRKVFPAYRNIMAGEKRSYLRVSDNGLVYRQFPWWEIRCKWNDVKEIKNNPLFGVTLYLHRAEQIGMPEFSINIQTPQIHLSSLVGWADGRLKEDLQKHLPQLNINKM